jgi:hypothetical protein|tara:strand:- start:180 stop:374 length:195 start_codon:yes stop_codon:yes gene_type:complete
MDLSQVIIDRANELAKSDFSSNFDEDCPMTTLAEALTFFAMEGIEDVSEVDSSEVYDLIYSKLN